jgi:hypothetical protein
MWLFVIDPACNSRAPLCSSMALLLTDDRLYRRFDEMVDYMKKVCEERQELSIVILAWVRNLFSTGNSYLPSTVKNVGPQARGDGLHGETPEQCRAVQSGAKRWRDKAVQRSAVWCRAVQCGIDNRMQSDKAKYKLRQKIDLVNCDARSFLPLHSDGHSFPGRRLHFLNDGHHGAPAHCAALHHVSPQHAL